MSNTNKQAYNGSQTLLNYPQVGEPKQINRNELAVCLKKSILPSAYQNKQIRSINHLIEDYLLHNLTNPKTLNLREGVVSIEYMSNSTYIGEIGQGNFEEQEKAGRGVYKYANNEVYMGDWQAGLFNGLGMYSFLNGDIYQGLFYNGLSTKGILYSANGNIYQGQFKDGLKHGHGVMKYHNSNNQQIQPFYAGNWDKDLRHGPGIYKCKEFQINGIWQNDEVSGQAMIISYEDSCNHSPYWQYKGIVSGNQLLRGNIKIVYQKGIDQFQGQIYKGKLQGKGKSFQKIKDIKSNSQATFLYEGFFKQNKPEGKCILKCLSDPSNISEVLQYEGFIKQNISAQGYGKIKYKSSDCYEGTFDKGLKSGQGVYKFGNGDVYVGQFKNDEIYGQGNYIWGSLNINCSGIFEKNKIISVNQIKKFPNKGLSLI